MTVKQLKEHLKDMPENLEVFFGSQIEADDIYEIEITGFSADCEGAYLHD